MAIGLGFGTAVIIIVLLVVMSFRVLREYERAVVFMLGRFWKVKGPGFFLLIPACSRWCASTCAPWSWTCRRRT